MNTVRRSLICMLYLSLTAAPACKSKRSSLESLSPSLATSDGRLLLPSKESHDLYTLMRSKEEEAGAKLTAGTLHNSYGMIQCTKMLPGALIPCFLRVKTAGSTLTQNHNLPPEIGKQVWTFMRSHEKLVAEPLVVADVQCSYIGKATPPYDTEESKCTLLYPRLPSESIIDGKVAEELANKLQGDVPYSDQTITVSGSLLCYLTESDRASECVLRPMQNGVLQEKFVLLNDDSAGQLYRALEQAARYLYETNTAVTDKKPFARADEYISLVNCGIDLEKLKTLAPNFALCKLTL